MQNTHSTQKKKTQPPPPLPATVAHSYVREMLAELAGIANSARLEDLAALLTVTLKAVDIQGREL